MIGFIKKQMLVYTVYLIYLLNNTIIIYLISYLSICTTSTSRLRAANNTNTPLVKALIIIIGIKKNTQTQYINTNVHIYVNILYTYYCNIAKK